MSWVAGSSNKNVRPASRGDEAWDPANVPASVQSVYRRVEAHATSVIVWYLSAIHSKRRSSHKAVTALAGKAVDVPFTLSGNMVQRERELRTGRIALPVCGAGRGSFAPADAPMRIAVWPSRN